MSKTSLCCGATPLEFPGGLNSMDIGMCPKCGEHTEFVELVYKVACLLNGVDFITSSRKEAVSVFEQYKENYGDMIRLYEAETPEDEEDAPDWIVIDYNDDWKKTIIRNI